MNVFYLDRDPYTAAEYHCDKHVVKMIVESCQLLCTAIHINGLASIDTINTQLYRPTHKNHPCAIWTASSRAHAEWLLLLTHGLFKEYSIRYNKDLENHKSHGKMAIIQILIVDFKDRGYTDPPQCMPDDVKQADTVEAYRAYYRKYKSNFAKWKTRIPDWYALQSKSMHLGGT